MNITTIKRKRISDEVLEQMKENIVSGEWSPGTKIPGEIELSQRFGVSRVSVREAIHRLAGMGLLTIRRGEGTFVSEVLLKDYLNILLPMLTIDGASLSDMLEFRAIIEVESARLATIRADVEDIKRLGEALSRMEEVKGDHVEFSHEDMNFHTVIAISTHNEVIIKVTAIMHEMLQKTMDKIVSLMGFEGGLYYHNEIFKAIKSKDERTAVKMMKEHIDSTKESVQQFHESTSRV